MTAPTLFMRDSTKGAGPMRTTILAVLILLLAGCAPNAPATPYSQAPSLPYAACGDMQAVRPNLTGAPLPTPESDAELRALGVRCVGDGAPAVRARY